MPDQADLDAVYVPSPAVVAQLIEGELIIVPLSAGVGDLESELFSLNETGCAVWDRLDEPIPAFCSAAHARAALK